MDLPRLMDSLRLPTRRLDNAARYPQLHSPNNNEGIIFLAGMKEKNRVACRGNTTLP